MSADKNFSLINLGGLSEVAKTLIEKIASATGWFAAPYQIKRLAKAEAAAALVQTGSDIAVSELQERALGRMIAEEERKQANIEAITRVTLDNLNPEAKPDQIDDDWIANFFEKSKIISDAQMQNLWGKILAGEANSPGSFSRRTINLLNDLDKKDAELFKNLCRFCFKSHQAYPIVFDHTHRIYDEQGLNFESINHLASLGLISYGKMGYVSVNSNHIYPLHYFGKFLAFDLNKSAKKDQGLGVGQVLLTQAGFDLEKICETTPVDGFFEYAIEQWKKAKFNPVTESIENG